MLGRIAPREELPRLLVDVPVLLFGGAPGEILPGLALHLSVVAQSFAHGAAVPDVRSGDAGV